MLPRKVVRTTPIDPTFADLDEIVPETVQSPRPARSRRKRFQLELWHYAVAFAAIFIIGIGVLAIVTSGPDATSTAMNSEEVDTNTPAPNTASENNASNTNVESVDDTLDNQHNEPPQNFHKQHRHGAEADPCR